jgi:hypothetical protein
MTRNRVGLALALVCAGGFPLTVSAQGQPGKKASNDKGASSIVVRIMAFDKNGDGQLTREEITDERLIRLFERADVNQDGVVTREELTAVAKKMEAEMGTGGGRGQSGRPGGGFGGPPDGGPGGGFGGPPGGAGRRGQDGFPGAGRRGRGPGGEEGGPGGGGRRMLPGQFMPPFLAEQLKLNEDQKSQFQELQKDVEDKIDKILTSDQKKRLRELQSEFGFRGRGGRDQGGPGGRGGPPGGPGGRPGQGGDPDGRGGPPDRRGGDPDGRGGPPGGRGGDPDGR